MPKNIKETSTAIPETSQVSQFVTEESLNKVLAPILESLASIERAIARPITSEAPTLRDDAPALTAEATTTEIPKAELNYPLPVDYRACVDSVLNKEFGVELAPHPDAPLDTVTIIVPDRYSNATADQKAAIGGRDIRPKVITRAGGVHELREWAETVYRNFAPEIQAQIVANR